jgi:hypothetical protein
MENDAPKNDAKHVHPPQGTRHRKHRTLIKQLVWARKQKPDRRKIVWTLRIM